MVPDLTQSQVDTTDFWEEGLWEELLAYIEDQRVIPIVGPDLLNVEVDGTRILLDRYIAKHLAQKLSLPANLLSAESSLNEIVCHWLRRNGRRERLYPAIRDIVLKGSFSPPRPLLQLAEISHFTLFVTTNFDSLLEEAINQVRFGGRAETVTIAYAPNNVKDLECPKESLHRPTVYHLLGKLTASPTYAISDEDVLEFVCALQSDSHRPKDLFDALEKHHLLILGENFPDWLARFFLRTAKRHRLSDPRDVLEILADTKMHRDPGLVLFLQHFSSRTRIFQGGGAVEFVEELWRRWRERNPAPGPEQVGRDIRPPSEMPAGAIFISYARQDLAAVQELKARLNVAGLKVWFDFDQLGPGDELRPKIRNNIRNCSCFLAVLSQNTEVRQEGFFRREWSYALDRDRSIYSGKPFIVPVAVDETQTFTAVPDRFLELHITRQPEGRATPEFVSRMQELAGGFATRGEDGR